MGPRSFDRGNELAKLGRLKHDKRLQWGRGLLTAEIVQPLLGLRPDLAGFNGAAVF